MCRVPARKSASLSWKVIMPRTDFAERLAAGLAGWLQQLAAQDLEDEVGEDAARVELVRMISAQRTFVPKRSQRPLNWPKTSRQRIDIAVLGRSDGAAGWYGAIEAKWPRRNIDQSQARLQIVQDAIRVAFASTSNLNARFLVVGGCSQALSRVFDDPHPRANAKEQQRRSLIRLFSRDLSNSSGRLDNRELLLNFPDALSRTPSAVVGPWNRRFATELVATADAKVGEGVVGHVYVWQCRK